MNLKILPMPQPKNGKKYITQAGVGLCAYKTTTQKAEAAAVFAKKLELDISLFPGFDEALKNDILPLDKACHIHDITTLPGASERVMLVSVPFVGANGKV